MLVTVKEEVRRYHVSFEIDNSVRFEKGPNKDRPQTETACKIHLVPNVRGRKPMYIAGGVTVLGIKDKPDVMVGLRTALDRALASAKLGRYVNGLIWQEFRLTHGRIDTVRVGKPSCAEKFSNFGGITEGFPDFPLTSPRVQPFVSYVSSLESGKPVTEHEAQTVSEKSQPSFYTGGPVHGYGGSHAFSKRAMKKLLALGQPVGRGTDRFKAFYGQRRHEYSDIPFQSYTGRAARIHSVGSGKTVNVRKIAGLGWTRLVNETTGEVIWPRSEAQKLQQLRDMYGYTYTTAQAESRCHRIGEPKPITIVNTVDPGKFLEATMGGAGLKRVKEIIAEAGKYKHQRQWVRGLVVVADDKLTAELLRMKLASVSEFLKVEAELLKRPGITRFLDEYIIESDIFVSEFCVGDIVTSDRFGIGEVTEIAGVFLTVQPAMRVGGQLFGYGDTVVVPDWDCEKKVGWLKRGWTTVTKWWDGAAKVDKLIEHGGEEAPDCVWPGFTKTKDEDEDEDEDEDGTAKIPGRGLWNMIEDGRCDTCHGRTTFRFLPGMYAVAKCRACGQLYRLNSDTRTATKA